MTPAALCTYLAGRILAVDADHPVRVAIDGVAGSGKTTDGFHRPRAEHAGADSILLFDGLFLLRTEIAACWDLHVFLDVPFDETLRPGEERYLRELRPRERAAIVIANADPLQPAILHERIARG
jgi:hypothetical protein